MNCKCIEITKGELVKAKDERNCCKPTGQHDPLLSIGRIGLGFFG